MRILDSKTAYIAPRAKEVDVNLQSVLCQSVLTEKFGMSDNDYDDDDWE